MRLILSCTGVLVVGLYYLDGTLVLFLRSLRQLARGRVMMYPLWRSRSEAEVERGGDFS
jgi:hypothetical protein